MKNEKGFTILEIMVALAILGTGFLLVVQLFSGGIRLASASDEYLKGVALAQHKFSELELANFEGEDTAGEFENQKGYRWQLEREPYASAVNDTESGVQLTQVTLTVSWDGPEENRNVQLTSLRTEGTIQAAPDTVLIGNISALGGNSLTKTSAEAGNSLPTATGTNPNLAVGPGSVPAPPPGSGSTPSVDPNFRFDISGIPIGKPPGSGRAQIGVTQ